MCNILAEVAAAKKKLEELKGQVPKEAKDAADKVAPPLSPCRAKLAKGQAKCAPESSCRSLCLHRPCTTPWSMRK